MSEIIVTKDNFDSEVMKSDIPVVVDFWASWCGPCKMLSPVVAQIAEESQGKIKVCKINIDEEEELAMKYQIMSIPTLLIVKNGEVVNKSIGFMSKEDIYKLFGDI